MHSFKKTQVPGYDGCFDFEVFFYTEESAKSFENIMRLSAYISKLRYEGIAIIAVKGNQITLHCVTFFVITKKYSSAVKNFLEVLGQKSLNLP